jgi:single-stranded DNA-binding protein
MAKHNQVILNGQISIPPKIICDDNGEPIRAMCGIDVMHGTRDFGNNIDNIKYDIPIVMTSDKEMVQKIAKFKKGDTVEIKGAITTRDITKRTTCKYCGHKHEKQGNLVCITPIFAEVRESALTDEKGKQVLRNRCEISNMVTVIAPLCRDPQLYITEKGTCVTTYQLAIRRKFRIKKDTDIRTDFPWVKSYGAIAQNDAKSLKKGSYVFIDGRIQVRQLKRVQECENCGKVYEWADSATEIVPYAVEYLRDFYTQEEILAREKEEGQIAAAQIFNEEEILLNRPTDAPDFNDDDTDDDDENIMATSDTANDVLD